MPGSILVHLIYAIALDAGASRRGTRACRAAGVHSGDPKQFLFARTAGALPRQLASFVRRLRRRLALGSCSTVRLFRPHAAGTVPPRRSLAPAAGVRTSVTRGG